MVCRVCAQLIKPIDLQNAMDHFISCHSQKHNYNFNKFLLNLNVLSLFIQLFSSLYSFPSICIEKKNRKNFALLPNY
ncbi:unnamed protein product [Brugia timori]|uniref:Uncharacterized protein n=1 Tax=Brugia timori TaxID=42155 RepID=A0A0R3QH65_9BILA|nr:unnamed protein product [Brugia timori]